MGQLLKLPALIHHYLEHHDDDAGISFAQFLHKHYTEEYAHPSPGNEHGKLPFKSHDIGFSQNTLVAQSLAGFDFKTARPVSTKENIIYSEAFCSSLHLAKIWQPPQYC